MKFNPFLILIAILLIYGFYVMIPISINLGVCGETFIDNKYICKDVCMDNGMDLEGVEYGDVEFYVYEDMFECPPMKACVCSGTLIKINNEEIE